jgi:hypothetical protein
LFLWQLCRSRLLEIPSVVNGTNVWTHAKALVTFMESYFFIEDRLCWHQAYILSCGHTPEELKGFVRSNSIAESGNNHLKDLLGDTNHLPNNIVLCRNIINSVIPSIQKNKRPKFAGVDAMSSEDFVLAVLTQNEIILKGGLQDVKKIKNQKEFLLNKRYGSLHAVPPVMERSCLHPQLIGDKWENGNVYLKLQENYFIVTFTGLPSDEDAYESYVCTCSEYPLKHFCRHGLAIFFIFSVTLPQCIADRMPTEEILKARYNRKIESGMLLKKEKERVKAILFRKKNLLKK